MFSTVVALESSIERSLLSLASASSLGELSEKSGEIKRLIRSLQAEIDNLEMNSASPGANETEFLSHREFAESASRALRDFLLTMKVQLADPTALRKKFFASTEPAKKSAEDLSAAFSDSLASTRSHLLGSLDRSQFALQRLVDSSQEIGGANAELKKFSSNLKIGEKVISRQLQREKTEKRLILCGVIFFFLVVAYIINKRLRILASVELIANWIN